MSGAIKAANELRDSIPGSVILQQFENPANPQRHYETTGQEIWNQTDGKIDIFVAGVGTGGTISGVARALKEKNPNVKIVAVEPASSAVLSGNPSGPHKIQGIGAGFVPKTYAGEYIDEILPVENDAAILTAANSPSRKDSSSASAAEQPPLQPPRLPSVPRTRARRL